MQVQPILPRPGDEAPKIEAAVLMLALALHPSQLTFDELVREIDVGRGRPGASAIIDQAIDGLAASGLLHRHGDFLLATRAAVRCDQLLD
jgi:hypothetical protein